MYDYIYKENLNLYKYTAICRGYSNHNAGDSKIIYIYICTKNRRSRLSLEIRIFGKRNTNA